MKYTAAHLRAHRALHRAAGLKIRRGRMPRSKGPTKARLRYQTFLTGLCRDMRAAFAEVLYPALSELITAGDRERGRGDSIRMDATADELNALFERLRLVFLRMRPDTEPIVENVAQAVDEQSAAEFTAQMRAAVGLEIISPTPWRAAVQRGFMEDNLSLITSLSDDTLAQARTVVSSGIRSGARVEAIRDELEVRLGVQESRAALIARDQTLKLYGEEAQARQMAVGIEEYTWNTSHDERVRAGHQALDGTVHRWDDPPIVDAKTGRKANPGLDYQCRCVGIPKIPDEMLQ